ncbi:MAG: hypothetical protein SPI30_00225 [Prevotella sp.]|nr:hypothetical protein [Prevotella sp.]
MSSRLSATFAKGVAGYAEENDRQDIDKRTKAVRTQRHMSRGCGFSYLMTYGESSPCTAGRQLVGCSAVLMMLLSFRTEKTDNIAERKMAI